MTNSESAAHRRWQPWTDQERMDAELEKLRQGDSAAQDRGEIHSPGDGNHTPQRPNERLARPGDTAPTIPATIYVKVSTYLLGELGEWSDPLRVKAEKQHDDTYELVFWKQDRTPAALDALLAENRLLKEEIRIREESQIPVIPHGAAVELERLRVENQSLREDLAGIAADTQRTVAGLQGWAREALRRV